MHVLLTGFAGNVGASTLALLAARGHSIRAVDLSNSRSVRLARLNRDKAEFLFGDIRNRQFLRDALAGIDCVIHLAAIIPPMADRMPLLAEEVNVGATRLLVELMGETHPQPRLIFTSSISVYGDRVRAPYIEEGNAPNPNADDVYAHHKLACEAQIRDSGLGWTILRLSYVVSPDRIVMDPLLFAMPLATAIEPVHTRDVALACVNAAERTDLAGETFLIAGGAQSRVMYRDYLDRMMRIFGLGRMFLAEDSFSDGDFHCGFMDTERSERVLQYQRHPLEHYFQEVRRRTRARSALIRLVRPIARALIQARSPYHTRDIESGRLAYRFANKLGQIFHRNPHRSIA